MSCDYAIEVTHLSKLHPIYDKPIDRVKQIFMPHKKYFTDFWALKNITSNVKKGEVYGIIGANGAGKSTLLQLICGTLSPTKGTVKTHGRVAALLELGSGFNPEFTGRENIYLNAAVLGLSRKEIDKRFNAIKNFADIGDFIDQPVRVYSSGMYVRLAFSVIAHIDADILIIDEALSVGDAFFSQKCMRFLRHFKKHGTILFVSHDMSAVLNLCDKALWLERGTVKMVGKPKEVILKFTRSAHCSANLREIVAIRDQTTAELPSNVPLLPPEPKEWPCIDLSVVTHNSRKWVAQYIESLCKLTYPREKIHIHFVDNNSTDDTVLLLESAVSTCH